MFCKKFKSFEQTTNSANEKKKFYFVFDENNIENKLHVRVYRRTLLYKEKFIEI